jgi:hypothetical protein
MQAVLSCLAAGASGCQQTDLASTDSTLVPPAQRTKSIPTNLHSRLVENSIAVTSVTQPGIMFGLNDSGHDAIIFAFDSAGTARGIWRVAGARNLDWEAAALGPCPPPGRTCLYIGDVGDNEARRPYVTIYRVPEPIAEPSSDQRAAPDSILVVERRQVRFPDHPHDVEAMYVGGDGALFLITKRRLRDLERRSRQALVFRVPASQWGLAAIPTATLVDSLPIVPGSAQGRQVTDAALSPDGRLLAVRTYAEVYVFAMDASTGVPSSGVPATSCTIRDLEEKQGEGIGWWWDRRHLVLTSEGRNEPLHVIACSLPGEIGV